MPCLYFEPTRVADKPFHERARLPLIDEYEGRCRATADNPDLAESLRWGCCNQGYAHGRCDHFPDTGHDGALRYSVTTHSENEIQLIWIEERDYAPLRHGVLTFAINTECFGQTDVSAVLVAQALAFCRSYLKRHRQRTAAAPPEGQSLHSIT